MNVFLKGCRSFPVFITYREDGLRLFASPKKRAKHCVPYKYNFRLGINLFSKYRSQIFPSMYLWQQLEILASYAYLS